MAKHDASFRLQDVSNLIQSPQEVHSSPEDLARTIFMILAGLKSYQKIHPEESVKMKTESSAYIDYLIEALQKYLRG
jgi:hypothetical protein